MMMKLSKYMDTRNLKFGAGKMAVLCLAWAMLWLPSCKKEKERPEIVIPTRVSFGATSYVVPKDANSFPIALKLSRPMEKDGKITIQILPDGTTAADSEYTINPQPVSAIVSLSAADTLRVPIPKKLFTIDLPKGATTASFTITSAKNFDDNKTIALKIVSGAGGAVLNESGLSTSLTLRGNNWIERTLTASLATLPSFGEVVTGTESPAQLYTLTGANLSGNVSVTASANYKVSTDNTTFSSSVNIAANDVNTNPVTVYVKFVPNSKINQPIAGTITHMVSSVPNVVVAVSGTEKGNVPEVPLMNENFSYGTAEDFLARITTNWVAYSAAGSIPVQYVPQGLSFTGYVNSGIDGALTFQSGDFSREDIASAFAAQNSGTVYTALMVNLKTAGTGDFYCALRDGTTFFNRLYAKDDGKGNLNLGMGKNSTAIYSTNSYKYNTTYLLVTKYDFATKIATMYVFDGAIPTTEPVVSTVASAATGTSPTAFNDIIIRQADGELSGTMDGIRIATTWRGVLGLTN